MVRNISYTDSLREANLKRGFQRADTESMRIEHRTRSVRQRGSR
jgi:hypothetical protein